MSVQWFPGHMAKTRRLIEQELSMIDVVVEILDARIPESSRNPLLDEIVGKKRPRLLVLNKEDLADPRITKAYIDRYRQQGYEAVALSSQWSHKKVHSILQAAILKQGQQKREKFLKKGAQRVTIRALIIGIPNVGKSSIINKLSGRASTKTGNKPGVTRGKQWIKLSDEVELLDTPGILWPKIDDEAMGYKLALTGAVSDEVFSQEEAAFRLVTFMSERYPHAISERYGVAATDDTPYALLEEIGRKRGALVHGGQVDMLKVSTLIIKDYRSGKLTRMTLE